MSFLFVFLFLWGGDTNWTKTGDVTKIGSGSFGNVYRVVCNNIRKHGGGDALNAISLALHDSRKSYRKEKSRFLSVEYFMRMYPFAADYDLNSTDRETPFLNLGIGLSPSINIPMHYNDLGLLITQGLYGHPWTVRSGRGVENIGMIDQRKKFHFTHFFLSFYKTSICYAPVHMIFQYDRKLDTAEFYLNGVLQNRINLKTLKENKKFGAFSLIWESTNRKGKNEVRIFELSPAQIRLYDEPAEIHPGFIKPPQKNKKYYDCDFEQAVALLYDTKNDWETGFSLLKKVAEQGHAPALYELACCYYRGIGCPPDRKKALQYLEKAAKYGVLEASSMRLSVAGLLPLTPDLDKKYVRGAFNQRNGSRSLLAGNRIISIKNNNRIYAKSLSETIQRANVQQKKALLRALKDLANSGDSFAMAQYAIVCNNPKEKESYLRNAFAMKEPSAIRTLLLSRKIKWESLDLERQLLFADNYLLDFAKINSRQNREQNLNMLRSKYFVDKDLKSAFAYSESLLRPYLNESRQTKMNAEQSMAAAAEQLSVAQIQYLRRYLEGVYGNVATAKRCLTSLKKNYGTVRTVKELEALVLEKETPEKHLSLWKQLEREGSVIALYYLGEYAVRKGDKTTASNFRKQFLDKDNLQNNFASRNIFGGNSGQFFSGYLEVP